MTPKSVMVGAMFLQVGSIFEYFNQNPLFGVVQPDNPVWAPILGVFVITGFPTAVSITNHLSPFVARFSDAEVSSKLIDYSRPC